MKRQRGLVFLAVIAVVLLLTAAVLATWYLINIPDRALDPGITRALQRQHDEVSPRDNLFYALLAFDSTDMQDINQQGQAIYAAYLAHRAVAPKPVISFGNGLPIVHQAFVGKNAGGLCGERGKPEDCVERAAAHPEGLRRLIADNRLLLDRYVGLAGYTRLQNPVHVTMSSPAPPWWQFMLGKRLFLTDSALQVAAGDVPQAVARLGSDIAFTRRMLAQPDILLIDKMILAASLIDSLEVVSDLVRTRPLSDSQYLQLSAALGPLTDDERSLVGPMTREFELFAASIGDVTNPRNTRALYSHFIKYNATLNAQWQVDARYGALSRGACTNLLAAASGVKNHNPVSLGKVLYNPLGNILAGIAAPSDIVYIHALCDMDGMIRIVQLQLQARMQHVSDDQLAHFAATGGARYANPFDGQPMHIDVARNSIEFAPVAERDRRFFPWPLASAAAGASGIH
jgi:hypothetical protein